MSRAPSDKVPLSKKETIGVKGGGLPSCARLNHPPTHPHLQELGECQTGNGQRLDYVDDQEHRRDARTASHFGRVAPAERLERHAGHDAGQDGPRGVVPVVGRWQVSNARRSWCGGSAVASQDAGPRTKRRKSRLSRGSNIFRRRLRTAARGGPQCRSSRNRLPLTPPIRHCRSDRRRERRGAAAVRSQSPTASGPRQGWSGASPCEATAASP